MIDKAITDCNILKKNEDAFEATNITIRNLMVIAIGKRVNRKDNNKMIKNHQIAITQSPQLQLLSFNY